MDLGLVTIDSSLFTQSSVSIKNILFIKYGNWFHDFFFKLALTYLDFVLMFRHHPLTI